MIEHVVFLLEEPSAAAFLKALVPKLLPDSVTPHYIVFQGKQDLEKQLARKIRVWTRPNSRFLILRDQDSGDCRKIKARLHDLCPEARRPDTVVRIACRQLEAFFVGDWHAIGQAFGKPRVSANDGKAKFRNPDLMGDPFREIERDIPDYQKIDGARRVSNHLNLAKNRSHSFRVLVKSLADLAK